MRQRPRPDIRSGMNSLIVSGGAPAAKRLGCGSLVSLATLVDHWVRAPEFAGMLECCRRRLGHWDDVILDRHCERSRVCPALPVSAWPQTFSPLLRLQIATTDGRNHEVCVLHAGHRP